MITSVETNNTQAINVSVRCPKELWKRVRMAALEMDCTAQQFCVEALELKLEREQKS